MVLELVELFLNGLNLLSTFWLFAWFSEVPGDDGFVSDSTVAAANFASASAANLASCSAFRLMRTCWNLRHKYFMDYLQANLALS